MAVQPDLPFICRPNSDPTSKDAFTFAPDLQRANCDNSTVRIEKVPSTYAGR